jgi:hypothetical protein
MRLVLHPKVYSEIDEIMGYYERIATPELSREFYAGAATLHAAGRGETGILPDSRA